MEQNPSFQTNQASLRGWLRISMMIFFFILGAIIIVAQNLPEKKSPEKVYITQAKTPNSLGFRAVGMDFEKINLGETTFKTLCVACHQPGGFGKVGFAPGIRNSDFLALASDDFLRTTIRSGRLGTSMVAQNAMGEREMDAVIAYIRAGGNGHRSTLTQDPTLKIPGDVEKGKHTYLTYCAACHGPNAEGYAAGGSGPGIGLAGFLAVASDDFIMQTVKHGRRGTAMLPFVGAKGLANLTEDEVGNVIAFLRTLPNQQKVAENGKPKPPDAKSGKMHFDVNCMACHQMGGLGKTGFAPGVRNPDFLALASDDFIRQTVKNGRPGTAMAPRPDLSDKVMTDIIAYLRSDLPKNRGKVALDDNKTFSGDMKLGYQKFATYCLACHGEKGTGYVAGGSGPAIGLKGFLSVASDDYIYQTVKLGRVGTAMRPFIGAKGLANLNDQDVFDIITYLRSLH